MHTEVLSMKTYVWDLLKTNTVGERGATSGLLPSRVGLK